MEIDANDPNSVVEVKSETMECATLFPKSLSCYKYSSNDVDHEKVKSSGTVKEEKFEISNTGIPPDDIRLKLDLGVDETRKVTFKRNKPRTGEKSQSDEVNYKCNVCPKSFATKKFLQNHVKRHTGERKYKCETCNKCFASKQYLLFHLETHTGEKNYECEICNKSFALKQSLLGHFQTHSEERNYKCEICNRKFIRKGSLLYHTSAHTEERNYECDICNACFRTRKNLSRHVKTHTRNHKCEICGNFDGTTRVDGRNYKSDFGRKWFATEENVSLHVNAHTRETKYKCDICDKCSNLLVHVKMHSGKELLEHLKVHLEENKKEEPFQSSPCIGNEITDIDKDLIKKEAGAFLNKNNSEINCDAKERKPSTAANENHMHPAIKEDDSKSLHSEIIVKEEHLSDKIVRVKQNVNALQSI